MDVCLYCRLIGINIETLLFKMLILISSKKSKLMSVTWVTVGRVHVDAWTFYVFFLCKKDSVSFVIILTDKSDP